MIGEDGCGGDFVRAVAGDMYQLSVHSPSAMGLVSSPSQ